MTTVIPSATAKSGGERTSDGYQRRGSPPLLESVGAKALANHRVESVEFLARGEYSLNYLVRVADAPGDKHSLVARLVIGTQINLPLGEQALHEHHALELLAPSGVTPKPHYVDPAPEGLTYPLILEE